jgi:DNA mismatch repair protein MutH
MKRPSPPSCEAELLARCHALAGKDLSELAKIAERQLPLSLQRAKGWIGELLEWHLGCDAKSKAEPDFLALGIELKTIPINALGQPQESTYVCTAPFDLGLNEKSWEDSWLKRKLSRVLWVPVQAHKECPLGQRKVGLALLWIPSPETESILKQDWEELTELLLWGGAENLRAHYGRYLQLRPKAAHRRILTTHRDAEGAPLLCGPKGFYLRSSFTKEILAQYYANPAGN